MVPRSVGGCPEARLSDGRQAQWVDILGEGTDSILQLEQADVGVQDGRSVVVGVNDFPYNAMAKFRFQLFCGFFQFFGLGGREVEKY